MQLFLVLLSVLSLMLFRRLRLREPWKVISLLMLSGGATVLSTIVMINWSKVPLENHVLRFEQLYTEKPEEANFVTANITIYLYTAYDAIYKSPSDRVITQFFQYDHRDNKTARPRLFENRDGFMKEGLYQSFKRCFPKPSDIDSVEYVSEAIYVYPSSVFISQKQQFDPHYYDEEHPNAFSHLCLYSNTVDTICVDSLDHSKQYINKLETYALTKGLTKSIERTSTYNHQQKSFWDKLVWLVKANDLSRTNYRFLLMTSSVDSLNLSIRYEEPSEFHGLGDEYAEQSPYYFTISRKISTRSKNSVCYFHARHLESENVQAMRMFFISSVEAIFLGFFIASLLSIFGFFFTFFTTKHKHITK